MKNLMKKLLLIGVLLLALAGCGGGNNAYGYDGDSGVLFISERFFVNQMQEIFLNHTLYLGDTIQYEGMFRTMTMINGEEFFMVYRYFMGCCGEEVVGLEVDMSGFEPFDDHAWVEVRGVLDMDDDFLVVRVTTIRELAERGAEVV